MCVNTLTVVSGERGFRVVEVLRENGKRQLKTRVEFRSVVYYTKDIDNKTVKIFKAYLPYCVIHRKHRSHKNSK